MVEITHLDMSETVKARLHHGAESLDLTIPTKMVRKNDIGEGDVFEVTIKERDEDDIVLKYKRVYKSEK